MKRRNGVPPAIAPKPRVFLSGGDNLPPHDPEAEKAALGCVLAASESPAEQDAILGQLRPGLFYLLPHQDILAAFVSLRAAGHAVDLVTTHGELRRVGKDAGIGGTMTLNALMDAAPTWLAFPSYLETLKTYALRRWGMAKSQKLGELVKTANLKAEDIRSEFAELLEGAEKIGTASAPIIEVVKPSEARSYVPDPGIFLLGQGLLCRGEFAVIAGLPGLGKSRLATTLAVSGALGKPWQGYQVARRFRTLIVQSENSLSRIKSEFLSVPQECEDWILVSKPVEMRFADARFRRELRRIIVDRKIDLLVIDPWADVARDDGFADHQEALDNIRFVVGMGDSAPAVLIVAHLRKDRGGEKGRPKRGRELLHELAGSYALGAKARTVWVIQPASQDIEDPRLVFDCAKSNNDVPMPMTAWTRGNGQFTPIPSFDFDAWLNPPDAGAKKVLTADIMKKALEGSPMPKKMVVDLVKGYGFAEPTIYRAITKFEEEGFIVTDKNKFLSWVES